MVNDFPEYSGQLYIKEFLDCLIAVESFFEDRNIPRKNRSSLSVVSLREVHGLGGSKSKGCVLG